MKYSYQLIKKKEGVVNAKLTDKSPKTSYIVKMTIKCIPLLTFY